VRAEVSLTGVLLADVASDAGQAAVARAVAASVGNGVVKSNVTVESVTAGQRLRRALTAASVNVQFRIDVTSAIVAATIQATLASALGNGTVLTALVQNGLAVSGVTVVSPPAVSNPPPTPTPTPAPGTPASAWSGLIIIVVLAIAVALLCVGICTGVYCCMCRKPAVAALPNSRVVAS
jgi:hypothetical protein